MAEREIITKLRELQSLYEDLNSRLVTLESWVGKAFFTIPPEIPSFPRASRWVLEIFPEEIEEWVRAVRTVPLEPLTERERSFLRNLEYYIATERKITLPQLLWFAAIQRKAGGIMPKIPIPPAESSHHSSSSPNQPYACEQCGTPFSTPQEICPVCYGKVEAIE